MQLVLQNARQILDIVQGTFPSLSFGGSTDLNCTSPKTDGEGLSCLWSEATNSFLARGPVNKVLILDALERVGLSPISASAGC